MSVGIAGNTIVVTNSEELRSAIVSAKGGETILLRASDEKYKVSIWRSTLTEDRAEITIKSEDPENLAVIDQMHLFKTTDLHFTDLVFTGEPRTDHKRADLILDGCQDVRVTDSHFIGRAETWGDAGGVGSRGMYLVNCDGVTVEGNEFTNQFRGLTHRNNNDITVVDNLFHQIQEDGIRGGGVNGLTIDGNTFTDWLGYNNAILHADYIQLWSAGTDRRTENVTITNNLFVDSGTNTGKQVIFARNDEIDMNGGDPEDWQFRNWNVSNNIIDVPTSQGIKLGHIEDSVVAHNTLTFPGGIAIKGSQDTVVHDNIAHNVNASGGGGLVVTDNVVVQKHDLALETQEESIFSNLGLFRDTLDPTQLALREGSVPNPNAGADVFAFFDGAGTVYVIEKAPFDFTDPLQADLKLRAFDGDGNALSIDPASVTWSFEDGTTLNGVSVSHDFAARDNHLVTVAVDGLVVSQMTVSQPAEVIFDLETSYTEIEAAGDPKSQVLGADDGQIVIDEETGLPMALVGGGRGLSFDPGQSLSGLPGMTVDMVFRRFDDAVETGFLLGKFNTLEISIVEKDALRFTITEPGVGKKTMVTEALDLDNLDWHTLTMTLDGAVDQTARLYFDGEIVAELPMDWALVLDDRSFNLGGSFAEVLLADFQVLNSVKSSEQVQQDSAEALDQLETLPPVSKIFFGDGAGTVTALDGADGVKIVNGGETLQKVAGTKSQVALDDAVVISENTVLQLSFSTPEVGKVHGFTLEIDGVPAAAKTFYVAGTDTDVGGIDISTLVGIEGDLSVALGQYLAGHSFDRITFFTDAEPGATAQSNWSNMTVFQGLDLGRSWGEPAAFKAQNGGEFSVSADGNTLTQETNAWTEMKLTPGVMSADAVLRFDFLSTMEGELHGVGFENDGEFTMARLFQIHGTDSWSDGIGTYNTYDPSLGTQHFEIAVGQYLEGKSYDRIVFFTDDDAYGGSQSVFSNIEFDPGTLPSVEVSGMLRKVKAYSAQNGGKVHVENDGDALVQTTNAWSEVILGENVVAANTMLSFDFSSTDEGEIHGFRLEDGNGSSVSPIFKLYGYQGVENAVTNYTYTGGGSSQHFDIMLGSYAEGLVYDRIVFLTDDDANGGSNSTFANITIETGDVSEPTPVDPEPSPVGPEPSPVGPAPNLAHLNFGNLHQVSAYEAQDGGVFESSLNGRDLWQGTNAWSEIAVAEQTITADMTVSFNFSSDQEGELHGIAFLQDGESFDVGRLFKIHGQQSLPDGINDYDNYDPAQGAQFFNIEVGKYLEGQSFDRVVFFTDDDAGAGSNSLFSDVVIGGADLTIEDGFPDGYPSETPSLMVDTAKEYVSQNGGTVSVDPNAPDVLQLGTNAWAEVAVAPGVVTSETVVRFDFISTDEAEVHGFALENDGDISLQRLFKVYGTQENANWNTNYETYQDGDGVVTFEVEVGKYLAGAEFDRIVFFTDQDAAGTGDSTYSNIFVENYETA